MDPQCHLFSSLVEVKASSDELVTLFSARDESLPSVGDAVRDVANGLRVVVVVGQESLCPLPDVDSAGVGFLKEETIKLSWVGGKRRGVGA